MTRLSDEKCLRILVVNVTKSLEKFILRSDLKKTGDQSYVASIDGKCFPLFKICSQMSAKMAVYFSNCFVQQNIPTSALSVIGSWRKREKVFVDGRVHKSCVELSYLEENWILQNKEKATSSGLDAVKFR